MNAKHAHRADSSHRIRRYAPKPGAAPARPAAEYDGSSAHPVEGIAVPEDTAMAPGATPPAESGVSGLAAPEREALSRGWSLAPLTVIWIVVLLVAIGLVAMAVVLATT
ncbi:DUF6480 family protein [Streptomyces sp. NPDC004629]|uniref:DUF6480 family protein n=1 Tax=Streptomyces sp. NPDC004629 TaxID=3364705 RepID=UPI0036B92131